MAMRDVELREARMRGCLLGGAVGDALGASVEFLSLADIRSRFGPGGLQEYAPAYGRCGAITDDTQMTVFTAERVIRAQARNAARGICSVPSVIHGALLRWLHTQGERSQVREVPMDGWLIEQQGLFARRAPGLTCLSALCSATALGEEAQNESKGCGSVMRIAPLGLFVPLVAAGTEPSVYELACASAKSTHGHRESTVSSGFFALVLAHLMAGKPLPDAIEASKTVLMRQREAEVVLGCIQRAESLARSEAESRPEVVETLGQGWVAEEALAIALFCALRAQSFEHGVRLAVNHGGDSDSTGSLTGQLLGALWGWEVIPERWLQELELRDVIDTIARDLAAASTGGEIDLRRYPPW